MSLWDCVEWQLAACDQGLNEAQLKMLKAQVFIALISMKINLWILWMPRHRLVLIFMNIISGP